jgi:predicted RND superfamily exporter protein
MSLWGIVLDGITLINLIMCIGFSVDFTAHFCYYYIECKTHHAHEQKGGGGEEQHTDIVEETLLAVKKPIIQVSTGIINELFYSNILNICLLLS